MKIKLTKDNWNNVRVGDKVYMRGCFSCLHGEKLIVTKQTRDGISLAGCFHTINGIEKNDYYIPATRTLENLDIGDEVSRELDDGRDDERRILMAQGEGEYRCYLLSEINNKKIASGQIYTAYELKDSGYTIKQLSDQEQPRELTIDEIAKKFGMKAEDVRIKKEAE